MRRMMVGPYIKNEKINRVVSRADHPYCIYLKKIFLGSYLGVESLFSWGWVRRECPGHCKNGRFSYRVGALVREIVSGAPPGIDPFS